MSIDKDQNNNTDDQKKDRQLLPATTEEEQQQQETNNNENNQQPEDDTPPEPPSDNNDDENGDDQDNNSNKDAAAEPVVLAETKEHQVGVTDDGTEPIMGRDRSVVKPGGGEDGDASAKNQEVNNEMSLDEEFAAADAAAQQRQSSEENNNTNDDQEQQQQQEVAQNNNNKIQVTDTRRTGSTQQQKQLSRQASSLLGGTNNNNNNAVFEEATASPIVQPPLSATAFKTNNDRSSSTTTSEIMRSNKQAKQQSAATTSKRSPSPARSQTSSHPDPNVGVAVSAPAPKTTTAATGNQNNIELVDTPRSSVSRESASDNNNNNQENAVVPASAAEDATEIPNTSQRHLYQYDQEYEAALQVYDSDVTSSEAASRFAVGIHSTAASATRHFADSCELAVDEADRLAERRNKNAHRIRSMISNELARYGFAGVAEELSEMTNVLVEDHRRRVELLEDRARLQMKSTLSSILREQEHAGEALRAEFVKSASVEFAQESLSKLIGGDSNNSRSSDESRSNSTSANNKNVDEYGRKLTDAELIMKSLKQDQESSKEDIAKEKGAKAAGDAYTNELLDRLSKIFDRQNGFAISKAQTSVSKAKANFSRLSDQLAKIEDENVRRLATQRDKAQRQISDLEALAGNVAKAHIIELTETEAAIERATRELEKVKTDKKQLEKDVWEAEEERRNRRKGGGVSAGGLLFPGATGLDYLNPGGAASGNNLRQSASMKKSGVFDSSADYSQQQKSKAEKEMDEKLKNASARNKALEDKNADRLARHREKAAEKTAADKNKSMSYSRPGAKNRDGNTSVAPSRRTTTNNKQNRTGSSGSPSLSRQNVGRVEAMTAEEKTRRHLQEHGTLQTREVDPRDGVSVHTRNRRGSPNNNQQPNHHQSPSRSFQQDAWIESEALRELVSRTARHGLSFPDGSDPVIPTHKFLDDELAAIYELRHLRGSPENKQ